MISTADYYAWFAGTYPLGLNFCLTFALGVRPDEVLERLGGRDVVELIGASRLEEAARLVPMRPDVIGSDGVFYANRITGLAFVAAAAAGEWTMIVEPNGFLCAQEDVIRALSADGELAALYYNENTTPRFFWARDGEVLVDFDPTAPDWRTGSEPDRLNAELERLGFDLDTEDDSSDEETDPSDQEADPYDEGWGYDAQWQQRVLALLHHLTGEQLTAERLGTAVFRCAAVPDPQGWARVTADPANIAPYNAEELAADIRARLRDLAGEPQ